MKPFFSIFQNVDGAYGINYINGNGKTHYLEIPAIKINAEMLQQSLQRANNSSQSLCGKSTPRANQGKDDSDTWAHAAVLLTQGPKSFQEDRYCYDEIEDSEYSAVEIAQSLYNTMLAIGIGLFETYSDDGWRHTPGCTATVCYVQKDKVITVQLGDSEAYLVSTIPDSVPVATHLTELHTARIEKQRIAAAGGKLEYFDSSWRLGDLEISRSLGDVRQYFAKAQSSGTKGATCEPTITAITLDPKVTNYLVLASDGVWDDVSGRVVADIVDRDGQTLEQKNRKLQQTVREHGSLDNCVSIVSQIDCATSSGYLYGVFDGHGGKEAAAKVAAIFPGKFQEILACRPNGFPGVKIILPKSYGDAFRFKFADGYDADTAFTSQIGKIEQADDAEVQKNIDGLNPEAAKQEATAPAAVNPAPPSLSLNLSSLKK